MPLEEDLIWRGKTCGRRTLRPHVANDSLSSPQPDEVFCTNGPTALGVLRAFVIAVYERRRTPHSLL
jgi:hypothetical protein